MFEESKFIRNNVVLYSSIFIVAMIIAFFTLRFYTNNEIQKTNTIIDAEVHDFVSLTTSTISVFVDSDYSDLVLLSHSDDLELYLNDPQNNEQHFRDLLGLFGEQHPEYKTIAYVDETGMEQVYMDNDVTPTFRSSVDLKNISSSTMFLKVQDMDSQSLFISDLLIIDNHPYVNLAVPVIQNGSFKGIITICYDGQEFLNVLGESSKQIDFPVEIGLYDISSYWGAQIIDEEMKFNLEQVDMSNPMFSNTNFEHEIVVGSTVYHYHIAELVTDFGVVGEHDSPAIIVATYHKDDVVAAVDNVFVQNNLLFYSVMVLIAALLTIITHFFIRPFSTLASNRVSSFISDYSGDGILILNRQMRTLYCNSNFENYFGHSLDEIYDDNPIRLISAEHRVVKQLSPTNIKGHVWNIRSTQEYILMKLNVQAIKGTLGRIKNFVSLYNQPETFQLRKEDISGDESSVFNRLITGFIESKVYECKNHENVGFVLIGKLDTVQRHEKTAKQDSISHSEMIMKILKDSFQDNHLFIFGEKLIGCLVPAVDSVYPQLKYINDEITKQQTHNYDISVVYTKLDIHDLRNSIRNAFLMIVFAEMQHQKLIIYSPELYDEIYRFVNISNILEAPFDDLNFYLLYQSQRNSKTGDIHGIEALVRLEDPQLGTISPNDFIPVIEYMDRSWELSKIVIKKLLEDLLTVMIPEDVNFKISINLSVYDLDPQHLEKDILIPLKESGINPKLFGFEITETMLVSDEYTATQCIQLIRKYGHRLLLDDFGTGYSSLAYLQRMEFDIIKIDKEFISGNKRRKVILKTIALLCKQLGVYSVIEGVETPEQLREIQELGIDFYQGFLDSKPMKLQELLKDASFDKEKR